MIIKLVLIVWIHLFGYRGKFKNVCALKMDLSPNKIEQYFWAVDGNGLNESNSRRTSASEIDIPKNDYSQFRFDFVSNGGTFTINGLYCKYCIDRKDNKYNSSGQRIDEFYAKSTKIKEENAQNNSKLKNLILEYIAPNV